MASVPCTMQFTFSSRPLNSSSSSSCGSNPSLSSRFLGIPKRVGWLRPTSKLGPSNGYRITCWFKFGKNGVDAEGAGIYGSQTRDDFDRDDVEQDSKFGTAKFKSNGPNDSFEFDPSGGVAGSISLVQAEDYFNYMGMLAVEGTYDKMEALLSQKIHPVDILLMMAASEGDLPKIEELLRAGANYTVKDKDGRTAVDRAVSDETKDFILGFSVQKA
ncbi:hypothetical protein LguiB_030164 [Lonicera macranthoides]